MMAAKHLKKVSGLFLGLCALGAASANAGLVDIGIKGGLPISTQSTSSDIAWSTSYAVGYMVGGGIQINTFPVGILADVLFAHRNVGIDSTTWSTNSFYIPVQLDFGMGPAILSAGAYYAKYVGDVNANGSDVSFAGANLNTSDMGLVVGVGAKVSSFSVEARFNWGLSNMVANGASSIKNRSLDLLVGYWF